MKLQEAVARGIVDGEDEDALSIWAYSQSQSLPIVRMTDNNSSSCDKRAHCCQTFITVVTQTHPPTTIFRAASSFS